MSEVTFWDHGFALLVFVGYPLYSLFTISDDLREIRERGEPARISAYRYTIVTWLLFAACLCLLWAESGREWGAIGIRLADSARLAVAIGISVIAILVIVVPLRNLARHPERSGMLESQLGEFVVLLPRTKREEAWFTGVSVNAGITEELIFRGYLVWYLSNFVHLYWAAGIAAVLFAFAHGYQGLKQIPGILLFSAIAVALFVYSGSLLIPVVFHIVLDILQGRYFARIFRSRENLIAR